MDSNSIFISRDQLDNSLHGRITYTDILGTIPPNSSEFPKESNEWKNNKLTEWRWRFLQFNNFKTVEISSLKYNNNTRLYFNNKGNWVYRTVPKVYDDYVIKEFYYYTS
jgi:hypothetical protein